MTVLENLVLATPTPSIPGPPPTAALADRIAHALSGRDQQATPEAEARLYGAISELYTLATEVMVKLDMDHCAWATADRAHRDAEACGDPLTLASATRVKAVLLRRSSPGGRARELTLAAADTVRPLAHHDLEALSLYGSLVATAAYTAAVDGDRSTAHTLIAEASEAARRLGGDANHRHTAFGPTGVAALQGQHRPGPRGFRHRDRRRPRDPVRHDPPTGTAGVRVRRRRQGLQRVG